MNIKQSFRNVFRNKTYSLLNIFGLAIGITSAALILLWVEDEVNYNRIFPKSKNLYLFGHTEKTNDRTFTYLTVSNPVAIGISNIQGINRVARSFKSLSLFSSDEVSSFKESGWYADSTLFSMLDLRMLRGNVHTAFSLAGSIVISKQLAGKLFGNDDPIGKSVKIDNTNFYQVTGVFEVPPQNSSFQFEWLRPFDDYLQAEAEKGRIGRAENWFSHWIVCYAELSPKTDVNQVNDLLVSFVKKVRPNNNSTFTFAYPLSRIRLYGEFEEGKPTGSGYIKTIRLFTGIACIILFIACINFMNLATARSGKRSLEVGVRKTFGAKKTDLISQFMQESGLVTLTALLLAVIFISLALPWFNQLVDKELSIHLLQPSHLLGLLGITVFCTLMAGSYPSFYLSSFKPLTTIAKMRGQTGGSAGQIRKGLVVFQFAIAFVLICATSVIYLQIKHIQNRSLGYDMEQVVMMDINEPIINNFPVIKNELQNSGYVASSSLSLGSVMNITSHGWGFQWKSRPDNVNPMLARMWVCPGMVETTGLKLLEGRDFETGNEADKTRVIINRQLAGLMGDEGHVGGVISREANYEIVGIVDNFVFNDIYKTDSEPLIIFNEPKAANTLNVRIKKGADMQAALKSIEYTIKQFAGSYPVSFTFMDEEFGRMFRAEQREGTLAGIFSILAVLISCLGLFGLSAFSAEQRTKEIGIRKVLGASVFGLSRMLVNNFLVLIGISLIVGAPIAWYATHQWLSEYEYRIDENWLVFVFAGLLVILIAILTVGFQSLKAATANPVKSIKME